MSWRETPFDGYFAKSDGSIWSQWNTHGVKVKKKKLTASRNRHGYFRVRIKTLRGFKTFSVHTLMLITFRGPRPMNMEARHLDGNKKNNSIGNLKWGTRSENAKDKQSHGTESSAWVGKRYCTKTICKWGHALTPENRNKRGQCRQCRRDSESKRSFKKKALLKQALELLE